MRSSCLARSNSSLYKPWSEPVALCSLLVSTVVTAGMSANVAANDADISSGDQKSLFEGDIFVLSQPLNRAVAVPDGSQLWPDGVVPYLIDSSLTAANVQAILNAVGEWNAVSAITLRRISEQEAGSVLAQDYVRFIPGEFCASWVGKRGGEQELWVAPNCSSGSLMHEIGHVIGLEHEHTRPDRNQYITIHWDNIQADRIHNFDAAPTGSRVLGAYDYDSIMHYGPDNFSINGEPTISINDGSVRAIGQRIAPSDGDIDSVGQLYSADLSVVAQTFPNADGINVDVFVTNEVTQGAHDITLSISTSQGDSLQIVDAGKWDCIETVYIDTNDTRIVCNLDRLPAGGSEQISLSGVSEDDQIAVLAEVQSKTPDSDLSNNSSGSPVPAEPVLSMPEPQPVLVAEDSLLKLPLQEDAVAHVGGGSVGWWWVLVSLLVVNRQTSLRVDNRFN